MADVPWPDFVQTTEWLDPHTQWLQNAAETGSFTPGYDPLSGSLNNSYQSQAGTWARLGPLVYLRLSLAHDSTATIGSAPSGTQVQIHCQGLPFDLPATPQVMCISGRTGFWDLNAPVHPISADGAGGMTPQHLRLCVQDPNTPDPQRFVVAGEMHFGDAFSNRIVLQLIYLDV